MSYLIKWQLARERLSQHDHACHPEEQNIVPRLQQAGGVVPLQVWGL